MQRLLSTCLRLEAFHEGVWFWIDCEDVVHIDLVVDICLHETHCALHELLTHRDTLHQTIRAGISEYKMRLTILVIRNLIVLSKVLDDSIDRF